MIAAKPASVDEYIAAFPPEVQQILQTIRATIKKLVPEAEEMMSYGMPAYKLHGTPLVYFGGYEKHIGLYALPSGNKAFQDELLKYKTGKGSIQFPLDKPMPLDLISRIVQFRVQENLEKAQTKKKR